MQIEDGYARGSWLVYHPEHSQGAHRVGRAVSAMDRPPHPRRRTPALTWRVSVRQVKPAMDTEMMLTAYQRQLSEIDHEVHEDRVSSVDTRAHSDALPLPLSTGPPA